MLQTKLSFPPQINKQFPQVGFKRHYLRFKNVKSQGFRVPSQVQLETQIYNTQNECRCALVRSQESLQQTRSEVKNKVVKSFFFNQRLSKQRCSSSTSENVLHEPLRSSERMTLSYLETVSKQLYALYKFSRPHTIYGTVIAIISVSLLPVETLADLSPTLLLGILKAIVPAVLMNVYVVGLNQLFDVDIDKINKPDLPLACGDFSMGTGVAIVTLFSAMSFAMGLTFQSPPLLCALIISFLLGSVYSIDLPFLRWKRHAVLAATCILSVRALVVQIAFFIHTQKYVLGRPTTFTKSLVFATAFMCFFSLVIALFKDIPDVDGDRDFGIESFSVHLGQERVFWLCVNMLLVAYGIAVMVGTSSSIVLNKFVTVFGHCTLASILLFRARSVDLRSNASITSFYMFIWKLFYAEYLLIPLVR